MSDRELVVLGTASQAPTRHRNHNGYLLRWDGEGVLFDPGEGTQRQLALAGVTPPTITRICITHFHGDHCLGLPGVLLRLSLDRVDHPVPVHYPASGQVYFDRLRHASIGGGRLDARPSPVARDGGLLDPGPPFALAARPLRHRVDTVGYRLDEPAGRRMLPDRLAHHGIEGPDIGRLRRDGRLETPSGWVDLDEVSEPRPGQAFAFVMDTAWCDAALALADGVDLLVCESTFLSPDEDVARAAGHLTARQAGRLAAEAGARRLVLAHFSQRYPDEAAFVAEAAELFPDVVAARDLDRIAVPRRAP
jgi:ribonuclease Z